MDELIENVYNSVALIGIVAAAWWFLTRRLRWPRATFEHRIQHFPISDQKILLRVVLVISNLGEVLLPFKSGEVKIYLLKPWPNQLLDPISRGEDPVAKEYTIVDWPLIGKRILTGKQNVLEVEPGETDEFPCDFILDARVEIVEIYSYIENPRKAKMSGSWQLMRSEIGWSKTTIYSLTNGELQT